MASEDELKAARKAKGEALREFGAAPFPNDFRASDDDEAERREVVALASDKERREALPDEADLDEDAKHYALYGRVMAKRGPFLVIRTPYGDAQALVRKDVIDELEAKQLKKVDLADHVLVRGPLIKTRSADLAVSARSYAHLSKAMLPPPEKWHGLKDVEKRYRERYVDLFANPDVARVFRARSKTVQAMRAYLDERDFLEVETPLLHGCRGGATAKPFSTHHNALDLSLFLRIAPELYLKRLLVGGFDRVYEIGRAFRNEGISTKHNPEFTILEFYMAYSTFEELMDMAVEMVRQVDAAVRPFVTDEQLSERTFDLSAEWKRVTMRDAIAERVARAGEGDVPPTRWQGVIDRATLDSPEQLEAACASMRDALDPSARAGLDKFTAHGERIFFLYELLVEEVLPKLYRTPDGSKSVPVFITEYPYEISPLARKNNDDPAWVDRFELFIEGREVANAFSELNSRRSSSTARRATTRRWTSTRTISARSRMACLQRRALGSASTDW